VFKPGSTELVELVKANGKNIMLSLISNRFLRIHKKSYVFVLYLQYNANAKA